MKTDNRHTIFFSLLVVGENMLRIALVEVWF